MFLCQRAVRQGSFDPGCTRLNDPNALRAIRLVHTLAWAIFAGCIVLLPIVAWHRNFGLALLLIGLVVIEVLILICNRMRCPLTDIAARYTQDRRDNFDIYLPLWLARYNKQIFGSLFVAGIAYTIIQATSTNPGARP